LDTLGSLIDRLNTVDFKMWNAQEQLYLIRHMTFQDFKDYCNNDDGLLKIFETFKKSCDLNYQRSCLIDEIDELVVKMIEAGTDNQCMDKFIQRKHKTY
jgi:hypothetical protein